jgi:hypothetical protein
LGSVVVGAELHDSRLAARYVAWHEEVLDVVAGAHVQFRLRGQLDVLVVEDGVDLELTAEGLDVAL